MTCNITQAEERAAVVAWLRNHAVAVQRDVEKMFWGKRYGDLFLKALTTAADAIERGDHIKGAIPMTDTKHAPEHVTQGDLRQVLLPVLHWYQSDEHPERPLLDIVIDIVADLQTDRADALKYAALTRTTPAPSQQNRFGSPPEPVVNPSESWCDAYADWYYQGSR